MAIVSANLSSSRTAGNPSTVGNTLTAGEGRGISCVPLIPFHSDHPVSTARLASAAVVSERKWQQRIVMSELHCSTSCPSALIILISAAIACAISSTRSRASPFPYARAAIFHVVIMFSLMLSLLPLNAILLAFAQVRVNVVEAPSRYPETRCQHDPSLCLSYRRALNRPPTPILHLTGDASLPQKIRHAPAFFARGGRPSASSLLALTTFISSNTNTQSGSSTMTLSLFHSPGTTAPLVVLGIFLPVSLHLSSGLCTCSLSPRFCSTRSRPTHDPSRDEVQVPRPPSSPSNPCAPSNPRVHAQVHVCVPSSTKSVRSSLSLKSTLKTVAELDLLFEKGVSARKFAGTCVDVFDDVHGASAGKGGNGEGEKAGERRIE
ncbi:hypothetical protein C8R44DRAFT_865049 [Mycena epipterygia]|nr:hypothetical protein C8R44DRAFT_865049 [Mycena epipterygia]